MQNCDKLYDVELVVISEHTYYICQTDQNGLDCTATAAHASKQLVGLFTVCTGPHFVKHTTTYDQLKNFLYKKDNLQLSWWSKPLKMIGVAI